MQFKITSIALAALATQANANFQAMKHMKDYFVEHNSLPQEAERTITQSDMDLINEYGCWCYFQNDHGHGRGAPVDEIDMLCKKLHDGYTCAIMDSAAQNDECVPWEIEYESALGSGMVLGMSLETIRAECDVQNPVNNCANWVCKIEGYFVTQLVLYFTHGGLINHSYRHANGFDPKNDCPISSGVDSEKACCDDYPLRFPFKTYNGDRQCCIAQTFDANLYSCCNDGAVRIVC